MSFAKVKKEQLLFCLWTQVNSTTGGERDGGNYRITPGILSLRTLNKALNFSLFTLLPLSTQEFKLALLPLWSFSCSHSVCFGFPCVLWFLPTLGYTKLKSTCEWLCEWASHPVCIPTEKGFESTGILLDKTITEVKRFMLLAKL